MKKYFLLFFSLFTAELSFSQWIQTNGPIGGKVSQLLKNPANGDIYCSFGWSRIYGNNGKGGNFYKSTTNCSSWTDAGNGLSTKDVLSMGFFPGSATNAVVCIDDKFNKAGQTYTPTTYMQIAYTNDGGASWTIQNSTDFTSDDYARAMTVDNTGKIFAGKAKYTSAAGTGGVDFSVDNGVTWTAMNSGLTNKKITDLCIGYNGVLYAGTDYHPSFNTIPGDVFYYNGSIWQSMAVSGTNFVSLVYDAASGKLYAVGNDQSTGNCKIYVSVNGNSFTAVTGLPTFTARKAVLAPNGDLYILSTANGMYQYNGSCTAMSTSGLPPINILTLQTLQVDNASTIYVTGLDGIYKTTSTTLPWTLYNNGIEQFNQACQYLMFNDLDQLFATTSNGTYMSPDYGNTWSLYGLQYQPCWALYNYGGGRLMASMYGNGTHVYQSLDNGATWAANQTGLPVNIYAKTELAKNSNNEMFLAIGATAQIFKSNVSCTNWISNCGCGLPATTIATALNINSADVIFTGLDNGGIYRSIDNGLNYDTSYVPNGGDISAIRFNSQGDVYFATAKRPSSGNSGIFRSTDGGTTWSANLFPISGAINCIAISALDSVYIGTSDGVYVSDATGNTWSQRNVGFGSDVSVLFMVIGPDGYLYASVAGAGIWKSTYNLLSPTGIKNPLSTSKTLIYPDPTSDVLNISFTATENSSSTFYVTDASGRIVKSEKVASTNGDNLLQMNCADLAPGIYFIRMDIDRSVCYSKFILER